MSGASVFVELKANISEFSTKMGEARGEMTKLSAHSESNLSKVSAVGKGALMGVAGAAIGIGGMAIEVADKQEIAQKQLEASLKASGTSWDSVKDKVKQTGDEATKYGYTQEQIDGALNVGVISTQNYGKAHDNLKVAIDLAAAKHVDLNTAMGAVDKAAQGNTKALKQLGIDLPIAAGGAKKVASANDAVSKAQQKVNDDMAAGADRAAAGSKANNKLGADVLALEGAHKKLTGAQQAGNNVLDALKQRLSGQADAAAESFAGKLAAAKAQTTNLLAEIGTKLMPVISTMITGIMGAVKWLEKHKEVAIAIGAVIGTVLVAAIVTYIATQVAALAVTVANGVAATAMGIAAAAAWLMALGPIGLLIAAVMAVIAIVVLVVTHWGEISKFFKEMWGKVTKIFDEAISAVIGFFKKLPGQVVTVLGDIVSTIFGALKTAGVWIWQNVLQPVIKYFVDLPGNLLTGIGDIIGTVFGALSGAWAWIKTNCYDPIVNGFMALPGEIGSAIGGALSGMASIGNTIINEIITGLNLVINTVDSAIGAISFFGVGLPKHLIPDIPHLAKGGPLGAGQMALVGENGPELFVPSGAGQIVPHGAFGAGGGRGGSGPVNITVQIAGHDVASVLLPSLQTTVLQAQRTSSVNIFGSAA